MQHSKDKIKFSEELSKQYNANSNAQKDTFLILKSFDFERRQGSLKLAAAIILERWKKLRLVRKQFN